MRQPLKNQRKVTFTQSPTEYETILSVEADIPLTNYPATPQIAITVTEDMLPNALGGECLGARHILLISANIRCSGSSATITGAVYINGVLDHSNNVSTSTRIQVVLVQTAMCNVGDVITVFYKTSAGTASLVAYRSCYCVGVFGSAGKTGKNYLIRSIKTVAAVNVFSHTFGRTISVLGATTSWNTRVRQVNVDTINAGVYTNDTLGTSAGYVGKYAESGLFGESDDVTAWYCWGLPSTFSVNIYSTTGIDTSFILYATIIPTKLEIVYSRV